MGKAKKKKEKKADFSVCFPPTHQLFNTLRSYCDRKQSSRSERQSPSQRIIPIPHSRRKVLLIQLNLGREFADRTGINLPSQALDNAFLEGDARRSAAFEHQLAMTKHYSENQRKGSSYLRHARANSRCRHFIAQSPRAKPRRTVEFDITVPANNSPCSAHTGLFLRSPFRAIGLAPRSLSSSRFERSFAGTYNHATSLHSECHDTHPSRYSK
jgi:hypothetical protein